MNADLAAPVAILRVTEIQVCKILLRKLSFSRGRAVVALFCFNFHGAFGSHV